MFIMKHILPKTAWNVHIYLGNPGQNLNFAEVFNMYCYMNAGGFGPGWTGREAFQNTICIGLATAGTSDRGIQD